MEAELAPVAREFHLRLENSPEGYPYSRRQEASMIDIDPRQYLPESYLVRWTCLRCEHRADVPLGQVEGYSCRKCRSKMTEQDRDDLLRFKRFIA